MSATEQHRESSASQVEEKIEKLALITASLVAVRPQETGPETALETQQVVGIQPFITTPAREFDYRFNGTEMIDDLRLSSNALANILTFYRQSRASERPAGYYNCHVFAGVVAGQILGLPKARIWKSQWQESPATPDRLEPGAVYLIKDEHGSPVHSLVGINRPGYNLSILGDNSPLVISRTEELVAFYEGSEIVKRIPL